MNSIPTPQLFRLIHDSSLDQKFFWIKTKSWGARAFPLVYLVLLISFLGSLISKY